MSADTHYFPPGRSMARRVHGDRAVGLLYGQRALLIGALEPLTYTGTMLATNSGDHPFTRLARTAKIQETIFLGDREEVPQLAQLHVAHATGGWKPAPLSTECVGRGAGAAAGKVLCGAAAGRPPVGRPAAFMHDSGH